MQLASVCAGGVARTLGVGCSVAVTTNAAVAATAAAVSASASAVAAPAAMVYGGGVRAKVLDVIARQVIIGAPWKEICIGPMQVNNISEADVEKEVHRRNQIEHRDNGKCDCSQCIKTRHTKSMDVSRALDAIPHTEKAPCACIDCRCAVSAMLEDVRKKLEMTET